MKNFSTTAEIKQQQIKRSDYDLLTAFVATQNESDFAEILKRYEQLVQTVCWRVLEDQNDVDDAFQATFLILIKNASCIRNRSTLSAWLYGVAHRTAVRIATRKRRMALLEVEVLENLPESAALAATLSEELLPDIGELTSRQFFDEELERLPEKYRVALVQRYLMNKSNREIAEELGVTVGTIDGRIKRGKHTLRIRLLKQGIGLSVFAALSLFAKQTANAATSQTLLFNTLEVALEGLNAEPSVFPSSEVNKLVSMEITKMTTFKLTLISICLLSPLLLLTPGHGGEKEPLTQNGVTAIDTKVTSSQQTETSRPPIAVNPESSSLTKTDNKKTLVPDEIVIANKNPSPQKPTLSYQKDPQTVEKIKAVLKSLTEVEFIDLPLQDALEYLADSHKITIILDGKEVAEGRIDIDETITVTLSGITLQSTLNHILQPLDLDYIIKDEVLLITTKEVADNHQEIVIYNLKGIQSTPDEFCDIVKKMIDPGSWSLSEKLKKPLKETEGTTPVKVIEASIEPLEDGMIIRQTQRNHRKIVKLLKQFQRYHESHSK